MDTEDREDLLTLLRYPDGTAGALMGTELIRVEMEWTVTQAIREMRKQAEEVETFHSVYVVNSAGQLLGRLSLKRLLLTATSARSTIGDLFREDDTRTVKVDDPDEKVVQVMKKYDLVALPVVDDHNRLLGRITIDDVVDLMEEEAEKDYQLASGLSDEVESDDSLWTMTRARLPWLLIGLFGGLAGAYVIGWFDIERFLSMALFIPLIAAMGGNVGVQSAAIVVQGLASTQKPHGCPAGAPPAQGIVRGPAQRGHLRRRHHGRELASGVRMEPQPHREHGPHRRHHLRSPLRHLRSAHPGQAQD